MTNWTGTRGQVQEREKDLGVVSMPEVTKSVDHNFGCTPAAPVKVYKLPRM